MRAALYARCSTVDQSVALQVDAIHDYLVARGIDLVGEYIDEAVSGAKARRPALDRLRDDAHRRRFDAVVVWKLDRLGRSLSHLLRVVEELSSVGIDLVSLNDAGLDTTGPTGRLIFHVVGAIAEFERDLIRERTRAGVAAARRRGKRLGRPRVHVPLAQARTRLERGESLSAVARELGVKRTTLQRALGRLPEIPYSVAPTSSRGSNVGAHA